MPEETTTTTVATAEPVAPSAPDPKELAPAHDLRSALTNAAERSRIFKEQAQAAQQPTEPAAVTDATGQRRDPASGQFLPKDASKGADQASGPEARSEVSASETPAVETPQVATAESAAQGPESQTVRIDIPEALRRDFQGRDHWIVSKDLEQVFRWNLNNVARNRELEELRQQLKTKDEEAQQRHEELQRELIMRDSSLSAEERFKATPEYKAAAERHQAQLQLEQSGDLPEGTALATWNDFVTARFERFKDQVFNEQWGKVVDQRIAETTDRWKGEARHGALVRFQNTEVGRHPQFATWVEGALRFFDAQLDAGEYSEIQDNPALNMGQALDALHKKFGEVLFQYVGTRPEVTELARRHAEQGRQAEAKAQAEKAEREQKTREAEAIERFKREQAEQRLKNPPHPLGRVAHGPSGEPAGSADAQATPVRGNNPFDLYRNAVASASKRAAAAFGRR